MVMLDNGCFPKVFGWREALLAHIDHEITCKKRMYEWEIEKILARINVIDGLLLAIANIDEVVSLIKNSTRKSEAKDKLIERFGFNEEQADAILKMPLSRIANLEIQSLKDEKEKIIGEKAGFEKILNSKELLYKEIEAGMRNIAKKFGDERRTRLLDLDFSSKEEDAEPIEKKELLIYYTNLGNIHTVESSTLVKTKRGGKGSKIKLAENEVITKTISDDNFSSLLVFSNKGKMYSISIDELPINAKINVAQLFSFEVGEKATTITSITRQKAEYFVFITKNGMVKKTKSEEYKLKRGKSIKAINLKEDDEVINVMFLNNEKIGLLTNNGNCIIIDTETINPIGRASMGVKGIKLNDDDYVIDSKVVKDSDSFLITLTKNGLIKKASMNDFPLCSRATKGKKISEVRESDKAIKFLTLDNDSDIIVITKRNSIKISTSELRILSRFALGVKAINLNENDFAIDLIKS